MLLFFRPTRYRTTLPVNSSNELLKHRTTLVDVGPGTGKKRLSTQISRKTLKIEDWT